MRLIAALILAVLATPAALAQAGKPTEASVKQLFEVMHSSSMVDNYMKQVQTTMHTAVQQVTAGETPNPRQQKVVDELQDKIMALVKEQLNWADLEPTMIEVYRDTFTQREVDGMLKFYQSEAGKAVIIKLPTVMQESMARIQNRVSSLTPRIIQLEKDAAAQIRAAEAQPPAPKQP
ncbi:MAG TPA: DUF2059 domain-containing protein [Steroidobacteraceae bacterium]|nr:DUF2059 domain-containing protein [Steroidobacteraceae bacterium]